MRKIELTLSQIYDVANRAGCNVRTVKKELLSMNARGPDEKSKYKQVRGRVRDRIHEAIRGLGK